MSRTRRWLETHSIPVSIEESKGSYKLMLTGKFGVRIAHERAAVDSKAASWQRVLHVFRAGESFTAEEACVKLQISRTSFYRLSTWALENQWLTKSGANKATVYRIAS
jgi:hypothetical protein